MTPDRRAWGRLLCRARPLSPRRVAREGGWLVLAPHPDDETLGSGGLVSALAAADGAVVVAFLTDGAASHVGAPEWTPRRIAALRWRETDAALRALGHRGRTVALGWRDARPAELGSPLHEATVRRLVSLCRRQGLRRIATSWSGDPHCDHQAAARVATDVARRIGTRPCFFAVWGWTLTDVDRHLATVRASAVPVARWRGRGRRALGCHRSQLGGRIHGAEKRFVLPRAMHRLVDLPHVLLLKPIHAP